MRKSIFLLIVCFSVAVIANGQKQKKRIFVTDTTSYLVPSKLNPEKNKFSFSDPYLKQLFVTRVKLDTINFPDNSVELVQHMWSTDFYKDFLVRKPMRGFFKHFDNTEIYLKENNQTYRLFAGAFEY